MKRHDAIRMKFCSSSVKGGNPKRDLTSGTTYCNEQKFNFSNRQVLDINKSRQKVHFFGLPSDFLQSFYKFFVLHVSELYFIFYFSNLKLQSLKSKNTKFVTFSEKSSHFYVQSLIFSHGSRCDICTKTGSGLLSHFTSTL